MLLLVVAALESDREYGENPEYQNPESDYQNLIIIIITIPHHNVTHCGLKEGRGHYSSGGGIYYH